MIDFGLDYSHFEIEKLEGLAPRVKVHLKLKIRDISSTEPIIAYIDTIRYETKVVSSGPESSTIIRTEGNIEESYSPNLMIIQTGNTEDSIFNPSNEFELTFFYLQVPTRALETILDLRMKRRTIGIRVVATIYFQLYNFQDSHYFIREPLKDRQKSLEISLTPEELDRLIADMHYTEILKIEIPVFNDLSPTSNSLKMAISNLQSAAKDFQSGNYHGVLLNTRNAVTNHLTELVSLQGGKRKRILKKTITDEYMSKAPTAVSNLYKKALDDTEGQLLNALDIVHKFVHEDNDKLIVMPLVEDMELVYFSIALITRYLARRLS